MSLPESMSRIVIVGTKTHIDETIEALYDAKAIHLIDHTVGADEGFTLGTPRPYSSKASERLLKVRAMTKGLGITRMKSRARYHLTASSLSRRRSTPSSTRGMISIRESPS